MRRYMLLLPGTVITGLVMAWSFAAGQTRSSASAHAAGLSKDEHLSQVAYWRDDDDDDDDDDDGDRQVDVTIRGSYQRSSPPVVRRERYDEDRNVDVDVDVDLGTERAVAAFYDDLAPYGEWVEVHGYGTCWTPYDVPPDWRPYSAGHWVWTDEYGWTWESDDEEWGWATFHYGRWFYDDEYGWCWLPGTQWAPAWVAWREGDGYVGWAPLPPRVRSIRHIDVNIEVEIGPHAWCFVHDVDLVRPRLYERVIYPYRNVTLLRTTRNVTSYTVVNRRIVNRGVPIVQVEQRAGIRVPKYQTVEVRSPRERRTVRGDAVAVVRPDFQQITQQRTTIQRRSSITTDRDVQRVPSTEIIRRQDDDLRRLESRHRVQQREFDDGLRRDLDGARDQSTAERTRQQREAERRALTDQQSRERRLIERQYDRERRGQVQPPRPDARRYRLDDADRARPEKDRARSGGRIEKQRKDD